MPPLGQHGGTLGLPALVWKGTPAQMLCSAAGVLGRGWSEGHGWVQPPGSCARSGGHVPLHPQMCALVLCCAPGVWQGHFPVAVWALHACAGSICHPEAKLTVRQGGERQNPQGKGFSSEAAVTSPRPRTSSAPQPPPGVRSRAGRAPSHSFVLQQGCSGGKSISGLKLPAGAHAHPLGGSQLSPVAWWAAGHGAVPRSTCLVMLRETPLETLFLWIFCCLEALEISVTAQLPLPALPPTSPARVTPRSPHLRLSSAALPCPGQDPPAHQHGVYLEIKG